MIPWLPIVIFNASNLARAKKPHNMVLALYIEQKKYYHSVHSSKVLSTNEKLYCIYGNTFIFTPIAMLCYGQKCEFILFIGIVLYLNRLSDSAACYNFIDFFIFDVVHL